MTMQVLLYLYSKQKTNLANKRLIWQTIYVKQFM